MGDLEPLKPSASRSIRIGLRFVGSFGNRQNPARSIPRLHGNVALYPRFQQYFRTEQALILAFWGKNDPIFVPPGAEAFKGDNPTVEVHLLEVTLRAGMTRNNFDEKTEDQIVII